MPNKKAEINKTNKTLLEISASELIPMLSANKTLIAVKQGAFDYFNKETEEHFQVQVVVTRRQSDFIEAFVTEETVGGN